MTKNIYENYEDVEKERVIISLGDIKELSEEDEEKLSNNLNDGNWVLKFIKDLQFLEYYIEESDYTTETLISVGFVIGDKQFNLDRSTVDSPTYPKGELYLTSFNPLLGYYISNLDIENEEEVLRSFIDARTSFPHLYGFEKED